MARNHVGTWHLIKDYLGVFLKKYQEAFVVKLLSKFLTKGNIESAVACKVWEKSHHYTMWMMAALYREQVTRFIEYAEDKEVDLSELKSQITSAASILTESSHITVEEVNEFVCSYKNVTATLKRHDELYKEFLKHGSLNDDQFALFLTAMEDFEAYLAVYLSIRSADWDLRVAGIKLMAPRFMRSGAAVYKWLIMRHLADITTYPENILERLRVGGWVSCLKDGKGVSLARDEYHERTASKDIKFSMPKQVNEKNLEVLTNFSTYSATGRRNFVHEFFRNNVDNKFRSSLKDAPGVG